MIKSFYPDARQDTAGTENDEEEENDLGRTEL